MDDLVVLNWKGKQWTYPDNSISEVDVSVYVQQQVWSICQESKPLMWFLFDLLKAMERATGNTP